MNMTQIIPEWFKQTEIWLIPEDWEVVELGEVSERIWDWLHWTPKYSESWEYYFINWNNIQNWKINIKADTKKVDEIEFQKYKKDLSNNTLLLSINWTIGNLAKYNNEKCILWKSSAYINVKEKHNINYIYYFLLSKKFQDDIRNNANWSTIKNVWLTQLRNYKLPLPPFPEQKAIAEILSSLDNKIELLEKQNKTLENIGQALFKSWFVDFEGFENDLVESEMGMIPRGWKVRKIKDFWNIVCWKTPSKSDNENFGWKIPFIKIPDMHWKMFIFNTEDSLTEKWVNTQKNKTIPKWSLVVSCIATVWLVSITTKDSQTNQQINSIIPNNEESLYFLYFQISNMYDYLQQMWSAGSATLNINTTSFSNIEIIMPSEKILKEFHLLVSDSFEKIKENNLQIQTLSNLRDSLLPRLMSGKIRVV